MSSDIDRFCHFQDFYDDLWYFCFDGTKHNCSPSKIPQNLQKGTFKIINILNEIAVLVTETDADEKTKFRTYEQVGNGVGSILQITIGFKAPKNSLVFTDK